MLALLAALTVLPPVDIRKGEGRFAFEEAVLENGLRVISLEDHSTPICAVQLWYHVGSKDEQPDRNGFAHMFEHMMFRGTDRLGPKDHFDFVRRTGGDCNAYTSFDQTVYVQEFPSNQLEMVLWLEAERMSALKIDEGGFATERNVVAEERRLGLNQPYGDVLEQVLPFLFREHSYRWSPIGQISHLEASTSQDIQHFWDTYYVPNNATLVVVGDVTHAQVRALAHKSFGWIPRCPEPPRVTALEPEQTEARTITIEPKNGPLLISALIFRTIPQGHADELPLEMLMSILGGGESSRVYLDVVRKRELALVALGAGFTLEDAGFAVLAGLKLPGLMGNDKALDAVVAAMWEHIGQVQQDGVTEQELEKVRNQVARGNVTESLTVASKANSLGQAAVLQGDAQLANTYLDRVMAVTPEDIQRVAQEYLTRERSNDIRIKPGLMSLANTALSMASGGGPLTTSTGGVSAETPEGITEVEGGERAVAGGPKAGAKRPEGYSDSPPVAPALAATIDIRGVERTLENGLRMVVVENHEVPFVTASLQLRVGAFTDDPDFPGTASMAASMITKGTVARDAEALAAELEQHAISLGASAGLDSASVDCSALPAEFERALRLMAEVVQAPAFDEKEWATLRGQTVMGMAVAEKTPSVIADRTFDRALWGDHPYGRPADGTSESVLQLGVERLSGWWARYVRPDVATLYVAGDITPDRAQAVAQKFLGSWEAEGDPVPITLPSFDAPEGTIIRLVDQPGAIQSEIRAGHEGITRRHEFYAPGVVLSQVFGGGFNSRLNDVIRVQKGLTYGARGGLGSSRFGGEFNVSTFTKTPTTGETVQAVIDEVTRMRDEPPSPKELSDAVSYIGGSFAGSLETPQSVVGRLWTLDVNGLPASYWNDYLARIASTTAENVSDVAHELLDPERLIIVVVGDASVVKEELEKIAPVEVVTTGG